MALREETRPEVSFRFFFQDLTNALRRKQLMLRDMLVDSTLAREPKALR
jgi:hypothetical protein